jgi:exopolysaccharide biosynthesis polyprenyl glycosylphosphotransferase
MKNMQPEKIKTRWNLRIRERQILLMIGDLVMSLVSLGIAIYAWAIAEAQPLPITEFVQTRLEGWFFLLPIFWVILLVETYDSNKSTDMRRTLSSIVTAVFIALVVYMAIFFLFPQTLPRRGVAVFLISTSLLTIIWRYFYIRIFSGYRFLTRSVLVGAGVTGQALLKIANEMEPKLLNIVSVIDDKKEMQGKEFSGTRVEGGSEALIATIMKYNVSDVIVAISGPMGTNMFRTLLDLQEMGIKIISMPKAYEELLSRVPVNYLESDWILKSFVDEASHSVFYEIFKRMIDIVGALFGLLVLLFIGPFIVLAIFIESGRPILFKQNRAGKNNVPFTMQKFRSMVVDAEEEGKAVLAEEDDARATKIGKILRKTHLDEWLQFFNVLKGEMSIVGPRPERPELVDEFQSKIPFYRARLLAKPGITGWAQIHYNYFSTLDEMTMKLEYDLYYIKHRNLWMDIFILIRTFGTIFGFRGR